MKFLDRLSNREKMILSALGVFLAVTFFWLAIYEPAVEKQKILVRKIAIKKEELITVRALSTRVSSLKSQLSQFEARLVKKGAGSSPLAETEAVAVSSGVRDKITAMSPSPPVTNDRFIETLMEIKMKGVTLSGLIRFLESLTGPKNAARVNRIVIRPEFDDPSQLAVSLTLAFYEVKQ